MKKIVCLCGGVGGAKLAYGFSKILSNRELAIIVNTGDDFDHLGFHISPDIDTVTYTLAGINNRELGWGIEGETWQFMEKVRRDHPREAWFNLGDKDLQTHRERKQLLSQGKSLTEVTAIISHRHGARHAVVPMSDDKVRTIVKTTVGEIPFQEYFVREECMPTVTGFRLDGLEQAQPSFHFLRALDDRDLAAVVICPSNPFISIDPILALKGVKEKLNALEIPVIAISPIIGGQAIKGPTAKIMQELHIPLSTSSIAQHYSDVIDILVIDNHDASEKAAVEAQGIRCLATQTLMKTEADKVALARFILAAI